MVHAGFISYEGASGTPGQLSSTQCWGQNQGLRTGEISAFRIATVVLGGYSQVDPNNWSRAGISTIVPRSVGWVRLIPTAAHMLSLPVLQGIDYRDFSIEDIVRLDDLGYYNLIPSRFYHMLK